MNALLQQFTEFIRRFPFVVASLTLFVLLNIGNYFLWQQHQAITLQHDAARHSGETVLLALSGQSRINAELAAVDGALKVINRNLIVEGDLAENLGYFYELETRSSVRLSELNQLSSQPQADGSPYKSIPFSLRAVGTFPHIISFLRELETGPRILRIRTYSLSRNDPTSNALTLDGTVELLASP